MHPDRLVAGRAALLATASAAFVGRTDVLGLFVAGSVAAGTADAWSDIDLRVVVTPDSHPWFVENRRDIPARWPGFLFNEWLPGAQHCVSHFRPFNKIDVFYHAAGALRPSPWLALPIRVLHDPSGVVVALLNGSRGLRFEVTEDDVDFSISKGLAAAHEATRRARRGELLYAQTLLDEFRQHVMRADDLLLGRTPDVTAGTMFDQRGSPEVLRALAASFRPADAAAIWDGVVALCALYRRQVAALHERFRLTRPLANDLAAIEIVVSDLA
jgi:hypothetical protein